jgi:hypothetical protein
MKAAVLALSLLALPGAAHAGQRIFSYDPADAATRARIDNGLTFVFDKGLFGMRVKELFSTQAAARAYVEPVDERELGERLDRIVPPDGAAELYRIADREQGPGMVRAFCPGSTTGWMVFSPMRARSPLTVHVLGNDPAGGKAKLCTTLRMTYRGEWAAPPEHRNTPRGPL